ncbi:MAG: 4a-hydroxytetrahydrobiopterin dehydratase [Pseudomonadota bacterium]
MPETLSSDARATLIATAPGWSLSDDGKAVSADLKFTDFADAWGFMTEIAIVADKIDHHPEWSNVYNRVSVTLTTHDADGLTARDQALADAIAAALGRRGHGA